MSIYRSLPDSPSLEHLKGQAKDWLAALRAKDAEATRRFETSHPRAREALAAGPRLSDTQFALAREYDFPSWPALHDYVSTGASSLKATFREALDAGDTARVAALLEQQPTLVTARFAPNNDTPLHLMASANKSEICELLVARGAVLTALNSWRGTPLIGALIEGHAALAALLVRLGARPVTLAEAAGLGDLERMRAYWDASGKLLPQAASAFGWELAPGVWEYRAQEVNERAVLQNGLEYACRNGQLEAAEWMLERGADLHGTGFFGATPLHWAAGRGQDAIVRFLLARGADPRRRDPTFDGTPFGWALHFNHPTTAKLLRELGHDDRETAPA